jgi:hypothetical protein
MDIKQVTEKIFNFCKEKYPDLDWDIKSARKDSTYIKSTIRIWGKTNGIDISIEIIGTRLESYAVSGDVSALISEARWSGSFKIWLDKKESQFSFKSKRELDMSTDLFIKAKEILSSIFEFIETKI